VDDDITKLREFVGFFLTQVDYLEGKFIKLSQEASGEKLFDA